VKPINFIQGELFHKLSTPEEDNINFKLCTNCNQVKELKYFSFREPKVGKSLRTECKKCTREKNKTIKQLMLKNTRPNNLKYKCPCCNKTEKELKKHGKWNDRSVWVLDHNHLTKEFRGWICNNCNVGLGRFYDDINIIKNVLTYLNRR